MKTIAQQLNVKNFPFEIKDDNGNKIYREYSDGIWHKREYDSSGNEIYFEDSFGNWDKVDYDSKGNQVYHEKSNGTWYKREYDIDGYQIYFEDSSGNKIYYGNSFHETTIDNFKKKWNQQWMR